jgi:hypothetical protein
LTAMSGYDRIVTRILAGSSVLRALYTANTGVRTISFNNGAGPGVLVAMGAADGGSRWAFESSRLPPGPEASRRGCPARNQAEQRVGPESERDERMTRVPLSRTGGDGATRADLSIGVVAEVARPALRPRLAGEARHGHKKQVPRARGPQSASWLRPDCTQDPLNFCGFNLLRPALSFRLLWAYLACCELARLKHDHAGQSEEGFDFGLSRDL